MLHKRAQLLPLLVSLPVCSAEISTKETCEESGSAGFGDMFLEMNHEFGGSDREPIFHSKVCAGDDIKADLFGFLPDPCDLLRPLSAVGEDALHAGFIAGFEGNVQMGPMVDWGGYDLVWDLYHHQMTVSQYSGRGVGLPDAGGNGGVYVGMAFGFEHGVADWDGSFLSAEVDFGIPHFQDFISVSPSFFVTAIDENGDGLATPDEIVAPPDGIYGFNIGVNLGFDIWPEVAPVDVVIKEGTWQPHQNGIAHFYRKFKARRSLFGSVEPHLVDHHDGTPCPEDWPAKNPERQCIIEFGDASQTHLKRSMMTARSICQATHGCATPLSWPISITTLAIGELRDQGISYAALCPSESTSD